MADETEARLGKRLGNYVLHEILGRGGMGIVYGGEHAYIKKRVAVKVLYRQFFGNAEAKQRFLREAQAASVIDHPNIVGVTDFGEEPDGTVFLVMDHVDGKPLDKVLRAEKTIDLFRAIVILSQVSKALAEAHRKGIVHRDLKPENIMLNRRPERREIIRQVTDHRGTLEVLDTINEFEFATVLDFGAAQIFDAEAPLAKPGVVLATPAYMAPETARIGVSDARSDIYALGVIFYQMLTGTLPFSGESAADLMMKHVREPLQPAHLRNPHVEITAEAERVIGKAMAKDPEQRHRTMDDLYTDLQRCYGSVRFRRTDQPIPDGLSVSHLRKPIPLTREKRPSGRPETPPPPVPALVTPVPAMRTPMQFAVAVPTTPGPRATPPDAVTPMPLGRTPGPIVLSAPRFTGSDAPTPPPLERTPTQTRRSSPHPAVPTGVPVVAGPVPGAESQAGQSAPIPLLRRKDRAKTLPFGVGSDEGSEAPTEERHRTQPYAAAALGPDGRPTPSPAK